MRTRRYVILDGAGRELEWTVQVETVALNANLHLYVSMGRNRCTYCESASMVCQTTGRAAGCCTYCESASICEYE
jgi:hypothetical protein